MEEEVKDAARAAESSRPLRVLARTGYAANGLVHVLVGALVLLVAFGGDGEADQAGAFKAVAAAPLGALLLWNIAICLWGLAAWHAVDGILARSDSTVGHWGRRISEWGQAAVFALLGVLAAAVALGARPDAEDAAEGASRGILSLPGGPWLLGAIGVGFVVAGIAFTVMGVRRSFHQRMSIPHSPLGRSVDTLGVVGFVAKGLALGTVGILLVVAAVRVDPDAAGALDGAVAALIRLPYGPAIAVLVGAGLIAYGVFCGFRARYARL